MIYVIGPSPSLFKSAQSAAGTGLWNPLLMNIISRVDDIPTTGSIYCVKKVIRSLVNMSMWQEIQSSGKGIFN